MTTYQAAIGFNNAGSMTDLALQPLDPLDLQDPRTPSNTPGRIQTLMDGHRQADGYRRAALVYDPYLTTTRLRAVLEQLGLRNDGTGAEVESSEITIRLPGQDREWEIWNAFAYHPHPNFERGRFAATTIDLILKEQLA
jgi:hypothetical protein